ncbi:hypothetical protein BsWGS_16510 [Bradybaena similaris]
MIWNLLFKLWPARAGKNRKNKQVFRSNCTRTATAAAAAAAANTKHLNCRANKIRKLILSNRIVTTTSKGIASRYAMERQRSAKGTSFRMRISRRIRSGFMPVPQQDSDSDHVLAGASCEADASSRKTEHLSSLKEVSGKKDVDVRKDKHGKRIVEREKKEGRGSLGVEHGNRREGGSLRGRAQDEGKYDLTVDSQVELGFSFRQKRRSFGSESEKRRGERFIRREIEKKKTVEESDDLDDSSDSSTSHVCNFNCPLLAPNECPYAKTPKRRFKAQRRSSFSSPTSRDTALTSVTSPCRRPEALASVSIDDIPGRDCEAGLPINSPGILSTASMWSTSDLQRASCQASKPEPDTVSRVGASSLSNVSETFSERMHELVRAFSNRTQKTKEKLSQPPTPSSESDNDAKSAVSGTEEPHEPRNIRLGSFLPMGSQASDALSDENHDHFVGVWHCKFKTPKFLKKLRFPTTVEPHSKTYVTWLFLVSLAFLYNAVVIPLRGVFPYQTPDNVHYWLMVDYLCDFVYLLDMVVFKCRLRFTNDGVVECDRKETRTHYMKKLMFKFDMMSLAPLDLFYFIKSVGVNPWLRLPRVLKIQTYWEFYEKCDQASRSSAHAIRIVKTVTYMLFLIHVETCGYYAVSVYEGLGTNKWVYSGQGIAYIRCFYLATKTATSIGNNPTPTNRLEYTFMTLYWLSGVFVFALLIGQIRDIVEAAGMVKDNYRKKMDSCLWYMQSINLPKEMKDRVRMWFLYNWEQQKTIDERSLVCSLPKKLQTDLAISVHFNTLSKVQLFQDCERNLLYDLVLKLRPILYLPGDYICKKGEVGKEMYIVSQGQVEVVGGEHNETVLATLHEGSVFGEISLLAMSGRGNRRTADVRSKGYTNVFTLSKHDFEMAMTEYPDAQAVLKKRAKKLLRANARLERQHKKIAAEEIIKTSPETPKLLQTVVQVMDPDSNFVKHINPIVQKYHTHFRKPHSRSHSHRLSTSASNIHLLAPSRSHSFRLSSQPSKFSRNPSLNIDRAACLGADSFDTDEDNDEPMFDDSSIDVSLSEALHDALAISSFDEDDDDNAEGDDEMSISISEQSKRKFHQGKKSVMWNHTSPETNDELEDENDNVRNTMQGVAEFVAKTDGKARLRCGTAGRCNGRSDEQSLLEERKSSADSFNCDSDGQPGTDTSRITDETEMSGNNCSNRKHQTNTLDANRNCEHNNRTSNGHQRSDILLLDNEQDSNLQPCNFASPRRSNERVVPQDEVVENYMQKPSWHWYEKGETATDSKTQTDSNKAVNKGDKLVPPCLVLEDQSSSEVDGGGVIGRVRKVSVVSPPVSPVSPRDKQNVPWMSGGGQVTPNKESSSDLIMKCFTPVETTPICPIQVIENVRVNSSAEVNKPFPKSTNNLTLANGLEGCCGSGPLMDIPSENLVTFAVEVHRQKNIATTTTDIHGHTETML